MTPAAPAQFKSLDLAADIRGQRDLFEKVERANAELLKQIGPSAASVEVRWSIQKESPYGRDRLVLELRYFDVTIVQSLPSAVFDDPVSLRTALQRFWGYLLEERSHKQLSRILSESSTG